MNRCIAHPIRSLAMVILVALSLVAGNAAADAGADAYNEGKMHIGKGAFGKACEAFERAKSAGYDKVKSYYWLGRCHEEQAHHVTAHRSFQAAALHADEAGDDDRAAGARERMAELEKKVPYLILTVPPAVNVEGLAIKTDGEDVPAQVWGKPYAVEPGKHSIEISAPGMETLKLTITANDPGKKAQLTIPALTAASASPDPPPDPDNGETPPPPPGGDEPEMKRKNAALFWTGLGLTIVGGLALVAGIGYWGYVGKEEPPREALGGIGLGVVGVGVGLPFMFVFGPKVPVEPKQSKAEQEGLIFEPTPSGLRVRF